MLKKMLFVFLLWMVIGFLGILMTEVYGLIAGAFLVAVLYGTWVAAERKIEKWLEN